MTDQSPRWERDPTGRHEQRYWDGEKWTDHVADGGTTAVDPVIATAAQSGAEEPTQPAQAIDATVAMPSIERTAVVERVVDERPWWRKKRFLLPIGLFILLIVAGLLGDPPEDDPDERITTASSTTAVEDNLPVATTFTTFQPTTAVTPAPTIAAPPTTARPAAATTARPAPTAAPTTTARPAATTAPPVTAAPTTAAATYVTPGAYCSPAGATGTSKNGEPMTCATESCKGEPYDRPRWRKTNC